MEFGDRVRFAVSLELSENSGGPWMFGKFCYWIDGKRVGDYDQGTSLRDVIVALKWIVADAGNREDCRRFSMPSENVYGAIDSSLYGHPENADADFENDPTARFDVCPRVDLFDACKVYLIECDGPARLLYKSSSDARVEEVFLTKGEFDKNLKPAWDELNRIFDRQSGAD